MGYTDILAPLFFFWIHQRCILLEAKFVLSFLSSDMYIFRLQFYVLAEPLRSGKKGFSYKISLRPSFKIVFSIYLRVFASSILPLFIFPQL